MPRRLVKGAALLQEIMDVANPQKAEEDRAIAFMERLPHVQAASRHLQGLLDIHGDETWPLPPLPYDRNPFILKMNAIKIRAALENCKNFTVATDRESGKLEFLDIEATYGQKRVMLPAGQAPKIKLTYLEEEKKATEGEASSAVGHMMDEGLQGEIEGLENEEPSEVPFTLKALSHSIGTTLSDSAARTSKGRDRRLGTRETMSDSPEEEDKVKVKEGSSNCGDYSPHASQGQHKTQGKEPIHNFLGNSSIDDSKEGHGKTISSSREGLDIAANFRKHSITSVEETQPKAKERNRPVPQPEKMPNSLTEAICSYIPLEAKSILTLTLERVDPPVISPIDQRCILLKHFEIGLDGIEGLCQGTVRIPETPEMTAERERRVGKLGTFKQEDGGFYTSLKCAQRKEQQYGKGYWFFFGVKFKQTGKERKLREGGKWLLFGAPIEAISHLDIKRSQENVSIMLGGGVDKSGTVINPFKANFKRTHTLFSRGGLAPMDIWPGGEDWDDEVFKDIRAAMANNGLRVGFLYADTQPITLRPKGFSAAGNNQEEKKRKVSGPGMTEDEMKAMERSMKPKRLSDEDIGAILATRIINDRTKQDAAARSK